MQGELCYSIVALLGELCPIGVKNAMKREIASFDGNFRGVCPLDFRAVKPGIHKIGRLRSLSVPAYIVMHGE